MADEKKPEDKKDPWLNYLALTTVIFAVCATLSTFKGGGYSTRSVISQAQASDQWAYYQAKSGKQNLSELALEMVPEARKPTLMIERCRRMVEADLSRVDRGVTF